MHVLNKTTYSRSGPFSRAAHLSDREGVPQTIFALVTSWKCARLMSYTARVRFPSRLFLTVRDEQREECFHTFQRWHSARRFQLHGLLDLSHDKSRRVVWSTRIALVGIDLAQVTLPWLLLYLNILPKDGLPCAHATAPHGLPHVVA